MSYTCETHGKLRMSQVCPDCLDELRAKIARLRGILVTITQTNLECPCCWSDLRIAGHTDTCALDAALKEDGT